MKNKVELKNGTVLEVGKKYVLSGDDDIETILFLDEKTFYSEDEDGVRNEWILENQIDRNQLPYEEPKTDKWYEYLYLNYESEEESRYVLWYSNRPRLANVILLREWDSKEEMIKDLKKQLWTYKQKN